VQVEMQLSHVQTMLHLVFTTSNCIFEDDHLLLTTLISNENHESLTGSMVKVQSIMNNSLLSTLTDRTFDAHRCQQGQEKHAGVPTAHISKTGDALSGKHKTRPA